MNQDNVLTMSDEGTAEYCCCVIRIGKISPIKNSDFLGTVNVFGTTVVVRTDQTHEGDIAFYAMHETMLNSDFLKVNNLYCLNDSYLNSNKNEVGAFIAEYDSNYKLPSEKLKKSIKDIDLAVLSLNTSISQLIKDKEYNDTTLKTITDEYFIKEYEQENIKIENKIKSKKEEIIKLNEIKDNVYDNLNSLINNGQHLIQEARCLVGFFDKTRRVKCAKIRGVMSYGFIFNIDDMAKFCPKINDIDLEGYINQNFDTVMGVKFIEAYIPPIKTETAISNNRRHTKDAEKRLKKLDSIVEGQFKFHYDTTPFDTRVFDKKMSFSDIVTISVKMHGTSVIIGNVLVKKPIKSIFGYVKRMIHKTVTWAHLPKILDCKDYYIDYGPVYSTRTIIRNKYLNKNVREPAYGYDIYSYYGDILYPYLPKGTIVYGEIIGYLPNGNEIQREYDYGLQNNESRLMIYRITNTDSNGKITELDISDIQIFVKTLVDKHPSLQNILYPMNILYHGSLANLYPNIKLGDYDHLIETMKNDKSNFGMEKMEPLCHNKVPREGICIRIDNDSVDECFKLKTDAFKIKESKMIDEGYIDIEMENNL